MGYNNAKFINIIYDQRLTLNNTPAGAEMCLWLTVKQICANHVNFLMESILSTYKWHLYWELMAITNGPIISYNLRKLHSTYRIYFMIFKMETTTGQGNLSKIVSYKLYDNLHFNLHYLWEMFLRVYNLLLQINTVSDLKNP